MITFRLSFGKEQQKSVACLSLRVHVFMCLCFPVPVCISCSQKKTIFLLHHLYSLGRTPTFLALSYFGTCLLQNERSVLRDDHRRSPQRNLKEESEPIFSALAVESGTHYDSLRAEMLWMMSESDIRASVRCHGDAQPNVTELREQ